MLLTIILTTFATLSLASSALVLVAVVAAGRADRVDEQFYPAHLQRNEVVDNSNISFAVAGD